ncbi:gamma-glutamyltranspeptidase [Crepidotus variabilis]|uniref:Glutathione hydrolase n=1 Tax=Crepidotus variabilis TaxID=179855 RepID=A0A9P6EM14_9AGAR|nr:gamma-glutamyltranspeptidase [Crepidotus variabilis]
MKGLFIDHHDRPGSGRQQYPRYSRSYVLPVVVTVLYLGLAVINQLDIQWPIWPFSNIPGQRNPSYLIRAYNGAVASENKRCSDIGVDIMKFGGNAVDAAIAATFCTGVVNMFSSGIGGGGFMVVRIPPHANANSSEIYSIDFREMAPTRANTRMYVDQPLKARYGGLSIGVPGELRGLQEAHERWGSLPWSQLVQPSVKLAAGWEVDRELGRRIPWFQDLMLNNPDWMAIFAPNGTLLKEGEIIRRTNLSRTLSVIAEEGPGAFYKGPIADSIIRKVRETGGILSQSDLQKYNVLVNRAMKGTYRGRRVYTTHAPTSGPVLLHLLNLMEHFDLRKMNGLNVHRLVEAMKFGFAARTKICDPAYSNSTRSINEIPTKAFAKLLIANITDDRTHPPDYYKPVFDVPTDHGTSHTSVVDRNGMAVAITSTINLIFGSQVMDPETGIILNDEMDDFSTPGFPNGFGLWPSPYNYPEPGKRPLSSIAPTIIENSDGTFYVAIGGSGGSRIFPAIFQTLLNLDWGMNVQEAVEYGRLHNQLYPLEVDADNTYPQKFLNALIERGHVISIKDITRVGAVINAIVQKDGVIYAASDSRKNGIAAGY